MRCSLFWGNTGALGERETIPSPIKQAQSVFFFCMIWALLDVLGGGIGGNRKNSGSRLAVSCSDVIYMYIYYKNKNTLQL